MKKLKEVQHDDGYGSYFSFIQANDARRIQYASCLERDGVSYRAPDILPIVRYYEAFPIRGDTVRWHYCVFDPWAHAAWGYSPEPVGYCAESCPGHVTANEAKEHYRQYILDHVEFELLPVAGQCRVCGCLADQHAKIAEFLGSMGFITIPEHDRKIPLCRTHANHITVNKIFLLSDFQEFLAI